MLLNNGKVVAEYLKPNSIIPEQDRLPDLFVQAELMTRVPSGNSDLFGATDYVLISHGKLDIWLFPLRRELEEAATTLVVGIIQKYKHDKFLANIKKVLFRYYIRKEQERLNL